MATRQEATLANGESLTLDLEAPDGVAEVIVNPGGAEDSPAQAPVNTYQLDIRTGTPGDLSAVDGSPVTSSEQSEQGFIVGELDSTVEAEVTNNGGSEGAILLEIRRVDEPVYPSANSDRRILSQKVGNLQIGDGDSVGSFGQVNGKKPSPREVTVPIPEDRSDGGNGGQILAYNNYPFGGSSYSIVLNSGFSFNQSTNFTPRISNTTGSKVFETTIPAGSGFFRLTFSTINFNSPTTATSMGAAINIFPQDSKYFSYYPNYFGMQAQNLGGESGDLFLPYYKKFVGKTSLSTGEFAFFASPRDTPYFNFKAFDSANGSLNNYSILPIYDQDVKISGTVFPVSDSQGTNNVSFSSIYFSIGAANIQLKNRYVLDSSPFF